MLRMLEKFGMRDFVDITCLGCGMLVMWDIWELGCSR